MMDIFWKIVSSNSGMADLSSISSSSTSHCPSDAFVIVDNMHCFRRFKYKDFCVISNFFVSKLRQQNRTKDQITLALQVDYKLLDERLLEQVMFSNWWSKQVCVRSRKGEGQGTGRWLRGEGLSWAVIRSLALISQLHVVISLSVQNSWNSVPSYFQFIHFCSKKREKKTWFFG